VHLSLFIIDSQQSFDLSQWLVDGLEQFIGCLMSVVADERHDKSMTLFEKLLGCPALFRRSRPDPGRSRLH
jgi:hypothetical protein